MIPSEWPISTRGIERAIPNARRDKPALACGAEGAGARAGVTPWGLRRNGMSRCRVRHACLLAGSLLLCNIGWSGAATAKPSRDAHFVGSGGNASVLARLVADARRSVLLSPGLRAYLPFAQRINRAPPAKSNGASSASPARGSRPRGTAVAHAENLFRRALVLGRAAKATNAAERHAASRAIAEAAWFFCVYGGKDGNLRNPGRFARRVAWALRVDPRNPDALFMKAMWIWWGRKPLGRSVNGRSRIPPQLCRAAVADLQQAVKIKPKFPEAWFALWLMGMINGSATAAQLVNTIHYAKSANRFLDGGVAVDRRLMVSDARAFLKAMHPAEYRKDFGHQPAPAHMALW